MIDPIKLAEMAKEALEFSHSPYSKFRVGSAVITSNGKTYSGCNIENSSFGLTNCAERTAIFKAVSEGEKEITMLAIASDAESFCPPCGACRQVMTEFMDKDSIIVLVDKYNNIKQFQLKELIPFSFEDKFLEK